MATIATITSGPGAPWGENNDMLTYEIITSDHEIGVVFRKTSSPPLTEGMEVQSNGKTAKGVNKFKVGSGGYSGGTSGYPNKSSGNNDDKMRSKEQCMRGEAVIAAASLAKSFDEATSYAQRFFDYIAGITAKDGTGPTPESIAASTEEISF